MQNSYNKHKMPIIIFTLLPSYSQINYPLFHLVNQRRNQLKEKGGWGGALLDMFRIMQIDLRCISLKILIFFKSI